jgi:hypothetical protein
MAKRRDPVAPGATLGVPTVEELLARVAQQQNEYIALSKALEAIADALIPLLAELQTQRSTRVRRGTRRVHREDESVTAR